jgi:hypothetical protein
LDRLSQSSVSRKCDRETIRVALHRLGVSWKKKLLGRADPQCRQAFVEQICSPVPSTTAIGWSTWTKSTRIPTSPLAGRSAAGASGLRRTRRVCRTSFPSYGLYLYNEGEVRLWPYACANGEHTIDVLRRLRAEWPS